MVSSGTAVTVYVALSTACLFCQLDGVLTEAVASGASHPLNLALQRASRGELSSDAAKAARALVLSYVVRDQVSTLIILNFVVAMYTLIAFVTKAMFLGPLTAIEAAKLSERMLKFLMLKLVFIAAITGPGMPETVMWVSWFGVVGFLKMFVGLARDRFDSLISSPTATLAAHARTLALLLLLFANDVAWIVALLSDREGTPPSHLLLWLFDTVVAALEAAAILVKYGVLMTEQLRKQQQWEGKGDFLYKVEVAAELAVKSLTLSHLTHLWWLHGFAFRIIDAVLFLDIRHLFCGICLGYRRYRRYRSATYNLKHNFPDAGPAELKSQGCECIICREQMLAAKLLPCGHVFHLGCLTAWLQQSGSDNFTCPLCRLPLFAGSAAAACGDDRGLFGGSDGLEGEQRAVLEHDVEAETFSSQVVGQALSEAARQLAEGSNSLLRQNWAAEVRRLELMVQNLRARLLEGQPSLSWQLNEARVLSPAQSMSLVAEFERQLGDIKENIASSGCLTSLDPHCQAAPACLEEPQEGSSAACG